MNDEAFNCWIQENRPLSLYLKQGSQSVFEELRRCRSTDDLDRFESELPRYLEAVRLDPPQLGGARPAGRRDAEGARREVKLGTWVSTTRHYVAVQATGSTELLRYWPDAELSLSPVDADPEADTPAGWTRPHETWTLGTPDDQHPLYSALYTYVDLTEEEEAQAANQVNRIMNERLDRIGPIVAAIATQTTTYFDTELPATVDARLSDTRRTLTNRQAVTASLTFPSTWVPAPPTLAPAATSESPPSLSSPPPQSLVIEHAPPLSPATFTSVQKIIRTWADAVERTPAAFAALEEDRLSDLLAATLNATVPFAGREVYTRGGKSDIYVLADVLAKGVGPAKVFICESKFARSDDVVRKALDPQLFGYLNNDDTAAVLILFFRQKKFASARNYRLKALRTIPDYLYEEKGPVEGWPVLRFEREGRKVDICVALIKVPL